MFKERYWKTRALLLTLTLWAPMCPHKKENYMNFDPQKTMFLIDGSAFLYRAYYSLRPLTSPQGVPVQAVFSFCRMIKKLADQFGPHNIALVWDSKGKTIRHEMFQDYKATRQAAPSDLFVQKEYILKFADMIGLKNIAKPGVEADDLLYSIAQDFKKDTKVVLITADKDMAQALDENVVMFDPFKEQFIDIKAFEHKMGFPLSKLPFYFALIGDTSDNIPGVRGIGPKGATDLVQAFDSLEELYSKVDTLKKERTRQLLQESKDNAFLSEKLFRLQYYDLGLKKADFAFDINNWENARPLFEELNFKSLLKEMGEAPGVQTSLIPVDQGENVWEKYQFITISTLPDLQKLCTELVSASAFAIDTETTGLDALQDACIGISISYKEGTAYYIPCGHQVNEPHIPCADVFATLKPIFENPNIKKYLFHTKFDQLVLWHSGIVLKGVEFDGLIAANLLLKEWQKMGLKDLSLQYFNERMLTFAQVVKDNKYKDFSSVPLKLATDYAAADAHQTLKLTKVLEKELVDQGFATLFTDIEMPLSQILYAMERTGILVDLTVLSALDKHVTRDLAQLLEDITALVGDKYKNINLNSTRQVGELLFAHLQLPPKKKSAKGTGYSTDQEVLEELSKLHPVPALILKYRELYKLKSTYIDALPTYINPETQRIHTTFSQTSVATGRLASYDPNLQNIPTDPGYGVEIRAAFKPEPGHVFLSADYSQIELRVLAHLSEDKNLMTAFLSGHDIHAETAARLFDVTLAQVTHEQRQLGKRINFSILYGLTPYGLSKDLAIPFKDAKTYIEKYFSQYPQVSAWMEEVIEKTKKHGYVTTHWGRRRYMPGIYEKNRSLYELARRIAINTKAQGTAAEIMKIGMINLTQAFKEHKLGAHMLLQIHDELLISVPEKELEKTEHLVKQVLESVVNWKVPLIVTTRSGRDWKEVTK
jgi:DNA polymerase-1